MSRTCFDTLFERSLAARVMISKRCLILIEPLEAPNTRQHQLTPFPWRRSSSQGEACHPVEPVGARKSSSIVAAVTRPRSEERSRCPPMSISGLRGTNCTETSADHVAEVATGAEERRDSDTPKGFAGKSGEFHQRGMSLHGRNSVQRQGRLNIPRHGDGISY